MIKYTENKEILDHFEQVCSNAAAEQEKLLKHILEKNKATEYGKKVGFEKLDGLSGRALTDAFRKEIPLSVFDDYENYIDRTIAGEANQLTADRPVAYCLTSGTTGGSKYMPISEEDISLQEYYLRQLFKAKLIEETGCSEEELFGCVFQINETFRTYMEDGTLLSVRTSVDTWYEEAHNGYSIDWLTSPYEVFFPNKIEDLTYVKVCFALANNQVTGFHGVFIHGVIRILQFIEDHWDLLLDDLEQGKVNPVFDVSHEWRNYLKENLKVSKERIAELRAIDREHLSSGMLLKIWPKMKYIKVISNDVYEIYSKKLKEYISGVLWHGFAYGASESVFGVTISADGENKYVLSADMCYFEFLPEQADDATSEQTLTLSQVEIGQKYEIVITTLSGLYRYRIGDVIEVVDKYKEAPVIKVGYRKGTTVSVTDVMLNEGQYFKAVHGLMKWRNITATEYCMAGCYEDVLPSYLLFIETENEINHVDEEIFDGLLGQSEASYGAERILHHLGCAKIRRVEKGTFDLYRQMHQQNSISKSQVKPLRVLKNTEQLDFFYAHVI